MLGRTVHAMIRGQQILACKRHPDGMRSKNPARHHPRSYGWLETRYSRTGARRTQFRTSVEVCISAIFDQSALVPARHIAMACTMA